MPMKDVLSIWLFLLSLKLLHSAVMAVFHNNRSLTEKFDSHFEFKNSQLGTDHYKNEKIVISKAKEDFIEAMKDGTYKARKELLCAVFTNTRPESVRTLRTNIIASAGFCDWSVILYDGDPSAICLNVTVVHCQRFKLKGKNVKFIPKTILYEGLFPHIKYYKRVLLMDQDISFMNFNVGKFLKIWDCSFLNQPAPLIVQPLIGESTQQFSYLHENSWGPLRVEGVISSATGFVEQQVPAFDALFLEWFIKRVIQPLRNYALDHSSDWGNDNTWCNAAAMYATEVLRWNEKAIVCGLIIGSGPVHHLDTRSLGSKYSDRMHFVNTGRRVLQKYIDLYPTWVHTENRFGDMNPLDTHNGVHFPKMKKMDECIKWKAVN